MDPSAVYLVVPLTAALAVLATYRIARHLAPAGPALLATACTACSPVFLFQMMQPMSDVPVTAWWLLAILFALTGSVVSAIGAGLAASIAVLTRPNIVPLILPVAAFLMIREFRSRRSRTSSVLLFLAACVPGIALVGAINQVLYGSALASGYGSPRNIYHVSNWTANARQYLFWLWTTHSIYLFIPCLMPLLGVLGHGRIQRRTEQFGWCALGFAGVLLGCYVFYERFDHWTYLRFLLPAIPVLIVATTALLSDALSAARSGTRAAVLAFIAATMPFAYVHTASRGDAFALKAGLRHSFEDAATFAVARLPPNAVYLALTESGSLRHYGGRLTVRYDLVEPNQADRLVTYLRERGLVVYAALTRDELTPFRRRFENTSVGRAAAADAVILPPVGEVLFFPVDTRK
jgi:4-amino-4-deoxy-L-arabinose transferase-like glycosyltransferase